MQKHLVIELPDSFKVSALNENLIEQKNRFIAGFFILHTF